MSSAIVTEFHQIVDRLRQEGHIVTTRLENAVKELESFFTKDAATVVAEVEGDAAQVATDAAPVVAEVKADAVKVATEVAADVQADMGTVLANATAKK